MKAERLHNLPDTHTERPTGPSLHVVSDEFDTTSKTMIAPRPRFNTTTEHEPVVRLPLEPAVSRTPDRIPRPRPFTPEQLHDVNVLQLSEKIAAFTTFDPREPSTFEIANETLKLGDMIQVPLSYIERRNLRNFLGEVLNAEERRMDQEFAKTPGNPLQKRNSAIQKRTQSLQAIYDFLSQTVISESEAKDMIIPSDVFQKMEDIKTSIDTDIPGLLPSEQQAYIARTLVGQELEMYGEPHWDEWLGQGRNAARIAYTKADRSVRSTIEKIFTGADIMTGKGSPEDVEQFVVASHSDVDPQLYKTIVHEYTIITSDARPDSPLRTEYLPALAAFVRSQHDRYTQALQGEHADGKLLQRRLKEIDKAQKAITKIQSQNDPKKAPYAHLTEDLVLTPTKTPRALTPRQTTVVERAPRTLEKVASQPPTGNPPRNPQEFSLGTKHWFDQGDHDDVTDNFGSDLESLPDVNSRPHGSLETFIVANREKALERAAKKTDERVASKVHERNLRNTEAATQLQKEIAAAATQKKIREKYEPLFQWDNPVQFYEAVVTLRSHIIEGHLSESTAPMTPDEEAFARAFLQSMVDRADNYLKTIEAKRAEKEKYTKGFGGFVRGLLNSKAKAQAIEESTIGASGIALWRDTVERIHNLMNFSHPTAGRKGL